MLSLVNFPLLTVLMLTDTNILKTAIYNNIFILFGLQPSAHGGFSKLSSMCTVTKKFKSKVSTSMFVLFYWVVVDILGMKHLLVNPKFSTTKNIIFFLLNQSRVIIVMRIDLFSLIRLKTSCKMVFDSLS